MKPALLLAAAVVLAGCGGVGTEGSTGGYVSGNGSITVVDPDEREKAPVLSGDDLDGRPLSTADFAGDTLVVNVWGSWCPPCRKEAPALAEVSKQYADRDVTFVGVLVRDKPAAALAFTRKQETPYRSIADFSGRNLLGFSDSLPSQAIPTTWIIDDRGRVAVRIMDEVSASTLAGLIDDVQETRRTLMIQDVSDTVASGSLLLAIPIAVLAGLVSFFSPCVVPLLPGYLSYVTGVGVQDLEHGPTRTPAARLVAVRPRVHRGVRERWRAVRLDRPGAVRVPPRAVDRHRRPGDPAGPGVHGLRAAAPARGAHPRRADGGPGHRAGARRLLRARLAALHRAHAGGRAHPREQRGHRGAWRPADVRLLPRARHPVPAGGRSASPGSRGRSPGSGVTSVP